MTEPFHPVAAAYDVQLRMRREAEERTIAQQDLNSWFGDIKLNQARSNTNLAGAKTAVAAKSNTQLAQTLVLINPIGGSLEDERLRGNGFFSQGKYEDAIQCYTRCLGNNGALESPVVYSNRSMAYLKLKKWVNAEQDATSALNIDPRHFKSLQRRSVARLSLGKLRAALMDACAAEDCAEDSKSLKEIHQLQQKIESALVEAVERAPWRKVNVEVAGSSQH